MQNEVDTHEAEKPELQLPVLVYFHADITDEVQVRERIEQIRHAINTALGDEENDLLSFTYNEVRLDAPTTDGKLVTLGGW